MDKLDYKKADKKLKDFILWSKWQRDPIGMHIAKIINSKLSETIFFGDA
jgi:hypothetical protein